MNTLQSVSLLHKERDEVRFILQRVMKEYSDVCHEVDRMRHALNMSRYILHMMAQHSESGITKYAFHHEPLREDAERVLPLIDEALGIVK